MKMVKSLFALLFVAAFALSLGAQDGNTPQIVIVDYMKATADNVGDYVDLENEVWADIHRQRQEDGAIAGWFFYHVRFSGTASEYDFVTVTTYDGWDKVDAAFTPGGMSKYWENLSEEQRAIAENTENYRDLVRIDVLVTNDFLTADHFDGENFPRFAMVNFMDVPDGGADAYLNMEKNMVRPMHEAVMKSGSGRSAWGLYSVVMPSGADRPYDFTTADFFNQWSDMGGADVDYEALFEEVHPNVSMDFFEDTIQSTRTLTRSECWVLINTL